MRIIREVAPEGVPIVIQGKLDGDGRVDPSSIEVFPIVEDDEGGTFILPKLPVKMDELAVRLSHVTT